MEKTARTWGLRLFATPSKVKEGRACLLGRVCAFYATLEGQRATFALEPLEAPKRRVETFGHIEAWAERQPVSVRKGFKAICRDSYGVDGSMMGLEAFDMKELARWYGWQCDRMDARESLLQAFSWLWVLRWDNPEENGGDSPLTALGLQKSTLEIWRRFEGCVGLDVERCLNVAWNEVVDSPAFCQPPAFGRDPAARFAWHMAPERVACRQRFVEAWKGEESRLETMQYDARDWEYQQEGV